MRFDPKIVVILMLTRLLNRLKYAYNIWRCPTPVNVSYYFLFDEKVPGADRKDVEQSLVASLCVKGAVQMHWLLVSVITETRSAAQECSILRRFLIDKVFLLR